MDAVYLKATTHLVWIIVLLGEVFASRSICDFSLCISTELKKATVKNEQADVCRHLGPALKCMEGQLPSCHKTMGRFSTIDRQYEQMYNRIKKQYNAQCKHVNKPGSNGKCSQFLRCLKPDVQQIAYQEDITTLCEVTPKVIECFEDALHECKKEVGKANYGKIDQLERKLEEMRRKTVSTCGGGVREFRSSPLLWLVSMVLAIFTTFLLSGGALVS